MITVSRRGANLEAGDLVVDPHGGKPEHWVRLLHKTDLRDSYPDPPPELQEWAVIDACPCSGVEHPEFGGFMAFGHEEDLEVIVPTLPRRLLSFLDIAR